MLAMAHFLGDFGLQSDRMAREKCPGCGVTLGWGWWLTSHAAIHGCLVGAITQSPLLGVAELIAHLLIDFGKCRCLWSLAFDQMFHIITKILWAWLAIGQASPEFWLS